MWKPPGWFGDLRGPLLNSYSDENLMGIFPSPKKGGKGKASDQFGHGGNLEAITFEIDPLEFKENYLSDLIVEALIDRVFDGKFDHQIQPAPPKLIIKPAKIPEIPVSV